MSQQKRKRRFGDRSDGRKIRTLDPLNTVACYIMGKRNDANNLFTISLDIENVEKYVKQKRAAGLKGYGILHVILAAYVRTVSQRPGINRFISGQKIFARNNIEVMMAVKKELKLNAEETIIKCEFSPENTPEDVYRIFLEELEKSRADEESSFDGAARIINYIPGVLLKFTIWLLNLIDYFGLLPKVLLKISPFHGSFFITSMGSLGIPPVYHHLYNFGNVPIFCSYGAKYIKNELQADGTVQSRKMIDLKIVTDERICDGHYYASSFKKMMEYLNHPERLDEPFTVVEDID